MFRYIVATSLLFFSPAHAAQQAIAAKTSAPSSEVTNKPTADEATSVKPELIPIEIFTAPGDMSGPVLSPDGSRIVYKEKIKDKTYLTIQKVEDESRKRLEVSSTVNWFRWAGDQRLLFSTGISASLFGVLFIRPRIYSYEIATGETELFGNRDNILWGGDVIHVDPTGRFFLMALQTNPTRYPSVYRVGLTDKSVVEILKPQKRVNQWIADNAGIVRIGLSFRGRSMRVFYRRTAREKFNLIGKIKFNGKDEENENTLHNITKIISGSDEGFILSNKETGRFALYNFNYLTREIGKKVFGHPENDVTDYNLNEEGTALLSVQYTDGRDRIIWFDDKVKKYQKRLEKAVPGQEVWIQSRSRDGKRMIVFTTSSTDPGSYYLFEPGAKKLHRFGGINDPLDPTKLAQTKYVTYAARDGLPIRAYLTLPRGRSEKALPLIIMPHGGPFGVRDTLDYNKEVQFLANRGYAILQPNYRGSDSYGEAFYEAGEGQVGRKMQDDLDDGMDWLVKQGTIDPKRVCVYGTSYGGYAAMWAVIGILNATGAPRVMQV